MPKMTQTSSAPRNPLTFTADQVDSYGDYGDDLAEELSSVRDSRPDSSPDAPVAADEFEAIYHWFLS
jgi:hypothetical protein